MLDMKKSISHNNTENFKRTQHFESELLRSFRSDDAQFEKKFLLASPSNDNQSSKKNGSKKTKRTIAKTSPKPEKKTQNFFLTQNKSRMTGMKMASRVKTVESNDLTFRNKNGKKKQHMTTSPKIQKDAEETDSEKTPTMKIELSELL